MNIVVCVKHIPDPNLPGELTPDGFLKREGVQGQLDPGDEFGVEAALQLKEAQGGEVGVGVEQLFAKPLSERLAEEFELLDRQTSNGAFTCR